MQLKPRDIIAGYIKDQSNTSVESSDRLTLLRPYGDGTREQLSSRYSPRI